MQNGFLTLVGAPNEFLRLIIIHFMFKYSFRIKNIVARYTSAPKKPFKASILVKLGKST